MKPDSPIDLPVDLRADLLALLQASQALRYGDFTLKSGAKSSWFVNIAQVSSGKYLSKLIDLYTEKLVCDFDLGSVDMLMGPAYKGISLASGIVQQIYRRDDKHDLGFIYNRKEQKTHGEGGILVGPEPKGNIVIIDDVLTAGTAIREAVEQLAGYPQAKVVGVLVAVDRRADRTKLLGIDSEIAVQSIIQLEDIEAIKHNSNPLN